MILYRNRWTAGIAALALFAAAALTACGGGGGGGSAPVQTSSGGMTEMPNPTTALFTAAQDAETAATTAAGTATDAVSDAIAYSGRLGIVEVEGDSGTAMENARKVLQARDDAAQAVTDIEMVLKDVRDALMEANDLDANTPERQNLIDALEDAIVLVEMQLTTAKEARDDIDLENAVAAVAGMDPNNPRTPEDVAEEVANAIDAAIDEVASIRDGSHPILAEAGVDQVLAAIEHRRGHSWAEIVGRANLVSERVGASNARVQLAPIAGLAASDVHAVDLRDPGTYTDGQEIAGSSHDGIPGSAFCLGDDCAVESGLLVGSWYFTPDHAGETYVKPAGAADYVEETLYARFGYWLEVDTGTGAVIVHTFAAKGDPSTLSQAGNGVTDASQTLEGMADYSGTAIGISVFETHIGGRLESTSSGPFTATVELTATFGNNPTVGGEIDKFRGSAVDPLWTVTLVDKPLNQAQAGNTEGGAAAGAWTTGTYGETAQRPAGIFGRFNAHMSNGHAAGAFATRKK